MSMAAEPNFHSHGKVVVAYVAFFTQSNDDIFALFPIFCSYVSAYLAYFCPLYLRILPSAS